MKRTPRCHCGAERIPDRIDFVWRVETGEHWRHACGPAGRVLVPPPEPKPARLSRKRGERTR